MEKHSEVIGLPVICVDSGSKIGTIAEVIFCPKIRQVNGIILERKGFEHLRKVILLKDILDFGSNAVIVKNSDSVRHMGKKEFTGKFKQKGDMLGLKVYTKSGDDLGVVKDVLFDCKTGDIEGVEVSDGLMQDLVKGRNILPLFGRVEIGEENILVDRESTEEIVNTGGGIKRRLLGENNDN